ncbi:MAG: MotA/TolQ/ExbB proton channel family protein [Verrucomicrobia bacterium]|nr:MotA/TolQ/ExbB proton channel family protein [Verrucomicrobiota bacterium]
MRALWFRLFVVWLIGGAGSAQTLDNLSAESERDLQAALAELTALRSQIEEERLPLARQLGSLEQEVLAARAALQTAQRDEGNQLVSLNLLRGEVAARSNEVRFVEALLGEYRRSFESRLHIAELARHQPAIKEAAAAAESLELDHAAKLGRQFDFLRLALARLESAVGGDRFAGQALAPGGLVEKGQFAVVGPAAWFVSETSEAAGVVEQRLNSAEPNVVPVPGPLMDGLRATVRTGSGDLPTDFSLGNAVRIQATRDSWAVHIAKGGPVMVPILLLGAVSLLIFLFKWFQVARVRTASPADLKLILTSLAAQQKPKAEAHAKSIPGPVGEMLTSALQHLGEPKEYIEEVMYEKMLAARPKLERWVPFLALAAAAAPLLGLLGTVTGMINTFNMITVFGTGDPKTLAGGISEALITTEFGLIVAIPSLLLHAVISRKVKGVLAGMEQTTVGFINGLPDPEPASNPQPA